MSDNKLTYQEAGVDVKEGARAVELMKKHVKETFNDDVIGDLGSFGGLLRLSGQFESPVLVAGTDGVGTKLKIAFMMDKHDTVGQDLVAMCVNDILCQGATPLFFLDYLATGHLEAEKAAALVKGITDGCKLSAMPLLGGETAEMPGFYQAGEYDMAGFAVGVVDESKIITGADIKSEDVLIGLASSGIHSNGYSLVRKLFFDKLNLKLDDYIEALGDTLGNVLIEPTKIYVKSVLKVLEKTTVKGMVHMTGGGFFENIPRIIPKGFGVDIQLGTWPILPVFNYMMEQGNIDLEEMFATFNMGIGYILVVSKEDEASTLALLESLGEKGYVMGTVTDQHEGVQLCQG
ncbi:phosphoribosylformylglycinamidine cyclo-ligase [Fusibacter ferrireducens]|uniref:Phosphoribosylformylglycinamidine cyclo-ligase n=1 Tax=Fusibacter ferrireducens TaxID=2785058 RepID=A0ABR9ZVX6_9FIRM|nr:phosphoribosylformylglycinamidine cyclo-ligase [Fusibacter ferrireducens]MBF4694607.1 phosphoribosylformylglycinamidine cyclo-ligase [Fusibacter ferrireducens]